MALPGSALNWIPVPCVAVEMTAECLCRNRTEIVHGEAVPRELLLEVDEGDARFCYGGAFFNVDLGTWSEKKKSSSAALIDRERCSTKWIHTRSGRSERCQTRTPEIVRSKWREERTSTWDKSNPDIDHTRHGSCSSGGCKA